MLKLIFNRKSGIMINFDDLGKMIALNPMIFNKFGSMIR